MENPYSVEEIGKNIEFNLDDENETFNNKNGFYEEKKEKEEYED